MPSEPAKRKADSSPLSPDRPIKQSKSSRRLIVPVDKGFHGKGATPRVYIDDDGVVYDASLNQTNIGKNANKFYRAQVIETGSSVQRQFWCLTRWGRLGSNGQVKLFGPGSLTGMMCEFLAKFEAKTGLDWDNRAGQPKKGKYTYLELDYEELVTTSLDDTGAKSPGGPSSPMPPQVQSLIKMMFDQKAFNVTLESIGYDQKKLPLGKLGQMTLTRAFGYLKDLEIVLQDPAVLADDWEGDLSAAIEELSNRYYSTIPHIGNRRQRLPLIDSLEMVKQETEMLDTLARMEATNDIMEESRKKRAKEYEEDMNLLDRHLTALNLDEITPLDPDSVEHRILVDYLVNTAGRTHAIAYKVHDIFRIRRRGEWERFDKACGGIASSCRRLLWHGSRTGNFGGILSQGLRIAPPEAPASGYMFDKGIYLADASTKSANYCCMPSGEPGLILICEAELGMPSLCLENADYTAGNLARAGGYRSTHGIGGYAPTSWIDAESVHPSLKGVLMPDPAKGLRKKDDAVASSLLYNEYIVYDEAQLMALQPADTFEGVQEIERITDVDFAAYLFFCQLLEIQDSNMAFIANVKSMRGKPCRTSSSA